MNTSQNLEELPTHFEELVEKYLPLAEKKKKKEKEIEIFLLTL